MLHRQVLASGNMTGGLQTAFQAVMRVMKSVVSQQLSKTKLSWALSQVKWL